MQIFQVSEKRLRLKTQPTKGARSDKNGRIKYEYMIFSGMSTLNFCLSVVFAW